MGIRLPIIGCAASVLVAATVYAQPNPNRDLFSGRGMFTLDPVVAPAGSIPLVPLTGLNGHLGCAYLGSKDRVYVSSRGNAGGTAAPHTLTEINPQTGVITNTWAQPSSGSSAWGYRDGTSDDVSTLMFGWDQAGVGNIEFFDACTGMPTTTVMAANGPQTVSSVIVSSAPTATARALAYDPNGDGGNGSIFTADFASDIWEIDLSGALLNTFPFNGNWSLYGLAFDHERSDPTLNPEISPGQIILWGYASPNEGRIVELLLDRTTTTAVETGCNFAAPVGLQGGCSMGAGGIGGGTLTGGRIGNGARVGTAPRPQVGKDIWTVTQTATDDLTAHRLERWDPRGGGLPLVEEVDLVQGLNLGAMSDAAEVDLVMTDTSWEIDLVDCNGGPRAPDVAAYFVNFPPAGVADCELDPIAFALFPELDEVRFCAPFTQPMSPVLVIPTTVAAPPLSFGATLLRGGRAACDKLRVQAGYADLAASPADVPIMFTNQCRVKIDAFVPSLGIAFTAAGANSFNSTTASGFFSLTHTGAANVFITRLQLTTFGTMMFDPDQTGMSDVFWGGNSTQTGCTGTYRAGSDAVLDYAATPPSPCPGALATDSQGFNPGAVAGVSVATIEFPFLAGAFGTGTTFEFDIDTDGGNGITGADMAGMVITIDYFDGSNQSVSRPMVVTVPGAASQAAF